MHQAFERVQEREASTFLRPFFYYLVSGEGKIGRKGCVFVSRTYRIVIALVLSLVLILALSTVAFAHGRSHGDDHGNKPGQSQYHRQDGDNGHQGQSDEHRQDGDRRGGDDD